MTFTFNLKRDDDSSVEVTFNEISLDQIFLNFEHFLMGCGFSIKAESLVIEDKDDIS